VRFGVAGSEKLTDHEDLAAASLLPKKSPVAMFLGATEDGKRVVFDISAEVVLTKGGGKCVGGRKSCGLLFIGAGEAVTLLGQRLGEPSASPSTRSISFRLSVQRRRAPRTPGRHGYLLSRKTSVSEAMALHSLKRGIDYRASHAYERREQLPMSSLPHRRRRLRQVDAPRHP
jgi:hypothetical protein